MEGSDPGREFIKNIVARLSPSEPFGPELGT
jgi:hypothetical protein